MTIDFAVPGHNNFPVENPTSDVLNKLNYTVLYELLLINNYRRKRL